MEFEQIRINHSGEWLINNKLIFRKDIVSLLARSLIRIEEKYFLHINSNCYLVEVDDVPLVADLIQVADDRLRLMLKDGRIIQMPNQLEVREDKLYFAYLTCQGRLSSFAMNQLHQLNEKQIVKINKSIENNRILIRELLPKMQVI